MVFLADQYYRRAPNSVQRLYHLPLNQVCYLRFLFLVFFHLQLEGWLLDGPNTLQQEDIVVRLTSLFSLAELVLISYQKASQLSVLVF